LPSWKKRYIKINDPVSSGTSMATKTDDVEEDARLVALRHRLVKARLDRGFTVEAAAAAMGVSRVQMWRMETNPSTKLTVERLLQLSDFYRIDPASLLADSIQAAPAPMVFDWVKKAVQVVEEVLSGTTDRPGPNQVADAVIAILAQESKLAVEQPDHEFDADGYRWLISALISRAGS
jgi:transcriptional regulator with XRE-family HTH domain